MSENVHVASANAETSTFLGTQNRILLKADQTDRSAGVVDILVQPAQASRCIQTPVKRSSGTASTAV
jgi:hypothetical protein